MSSIGSVLKEARNKKSISLEEVHSRIKIHPRVLQLLEEDKFDKLPSTLFVKSFLKSYADFLEINSEELLRMYERTDPADPEQVLFIRPAEEARKKPSTFDARLLTLPAMFLALVLVAVALYYFFGLVKNEFQKATAGRSGRPGTVQASKAPAAKKLSPWLRSVEQGNFPEIQRKNALELQVKALDNVWIRVTSDGKVLFQTILKRGATETWSAKDKLEIWTGNSTSMFLTLNNFGIGSPGKGVVKKMVITHEGVKIAK